MNTLEEIHELFDEMELEFFKTEENVWESLDEDTKLNVFCAVVRRLKQGELEDKASYRGILYSVFGFGAEAYLKAQLAGFLELHNAIFDKKEITNILLDFVKSKNLSIDESEVIEFCASRRM